MRIFFSGIYFLAKSARHWPLWHFDQTDWWHLLIENRRCGRVPRMLLDPEGVSTAKDSAENWLRLVKPRQLDSICSTVSQRRCWLIFQKVQFSKPDYLREISTWIRKRNTVVFDKNMFCWMIMISYNDKFCGTRNNFITISMDVTCNGYGH